MSLSARLKKLVRTIPALVLALSCVLAPALSGCTSTDTSSGSSGSTSSSADADSEDSIYVLTSIAEYDEDGELIATRTYTINNRGSYKKMTTEYEEEDMEVYNTTYKFTLNLKGFYTKCTYTTYDDEEEETYDMREERTIDERNDDGLPLTISDDVYLSGNLYYETTTTYTYHDNGAIESITFSEDADDPFYTFDEDGLVLTCDDSDYEYTYDEDGLLISCEESDSDGDVATFEYTYDEDGNVCTVEETSAYDVYTRYELTFEEVENPSVAAKLEAGELTYLVGLFPVVL